MSACAPAGTLLGQTTEYVDTYRPDLLTPIPRSLGRDVIGVHDFCGTDVWRLYEITWINERGLPVAAAGEIRVPATSPCIVESKSLKLYIGSLTQTKIASVEEAARLTARDISACRASCSKPSAATSSAAFTNPTPRSSRPPPTKSSRRPSPPTSFARAAPSRASPTMPLS